METKLQPDFVYKSCCSWNNEKQWMCSWKRSDSLSILRLIIIRWFSWVRHGITKEAEGPAHHGIDVATVAQHHNLLLVVQVVWIVVEEKDDQLNTWNLHSQGNTIKLLEAKHTHAIFHDANIHLCHFISFGSITIIRRQYYINGAESLH